jgi:uncharacterized membrane protein YphA (DoxX/SURF4 family)
MGLSNGITDWSSVKRILFRFAFAYLILFNVFGGNSALGLLWDPVILWVGKIVFGVTITFRPMHSGDTTWNYVQLFCFLVVAVVATVVWTVLDRRRRNYDRLNDWLRVIVRYSLAWAMIFYGVMKLCQFPTPLQDALVQSLGDTSPMGLLWACMGSSQPYAWFTGVAELLGGLLLISRRTTLLGALVCIGVMSNVVMLNYCYDVPVKILSSHLLVMAVLLVLPQMRRLADFFLFDRRPEPAGDRPLFTTPWANRLGVALRSVFFVLLTMLYLTNAVVFTLMFGALAPKPLLYGVWNVEQFEVDGEVRPPLLTDEVRWRRVIIDRPGLVSIQQMSDARVLYALELDADAKTWALTKPQDANWRSAISYKEPEPGLLTLEGTFDGRTIRARLRHSDRSDFLLVKRGFNWINEVPFVR